jgi:hypothetical protein
MDYYLKIRNSVFLFIVFALFVSCKTTRTLPSVNSELESISEARLFKNIAANQLEYSTMYSKKMDITLDMKGDSKSFKATMRVRKDDFIWFAMTAPLGIEIGRLLFTPDSVKFINSREKTYFASDYSYITERYGIELTFDCLQKILSNHFFNFDICSSKEKSKGYKLDRKDGHYLLYTMEERAIGRQLRKLYKKKLKNKEFSLILQKIMIDPSTFRPVSVSVEDLDEKVGFGVNYRDFEVFDNRLQTNPLFPAKFDFYFFSEEGESHLEIKIERLEFDVPVEPSFKIPAKYKRIK